MSEPQNFLNELEAAASQRAEQLNAKVLPDMLANYQLLHTCVKNMYDMLVQRSLIKADPYKLEKKVSEITVPDESAYIENERAIVMGSRLSDYETMLDFICTYYKFSIEHIDLAQIKKLSDFNNCIDWRGLSPNSTKVNTRSLATLLNEARTRAAPMLVSLISDSIDKSIKASTAINASLKELLEFQRESYKLRIRQKIIASSSFNKDALTSASAELAEIRRLFPQLIGKKPFYGDIMQEIIKEDTAPEKEQLRQAVLQKLQTKEQQTQMVKKHVDTKQVLLDAVLIISALAPQYEQVTAKIVANHDVIMSEQNSFFDKLKRVLRKAFNLKEPPEEYELIIVNQKTDTRTSKKIEYNAFLTALQRKQLFLQSFGGEQAQEFKKIALSADEAIFSFVNKQMSENQEIIIQLNALDEYFKGHVAKINQSKIKGMKMELVTMKNTIIKANQRRAEYISVMEENAQLKKLGMQNANQ
ncbi:MAG: hypothetical protein IJR50_05790 [Treponema sp.]|nr:hypothetical protein [Treponema sp.]